MTKEEILAMKPRELDKAILHTFFPELKSLYYSKYWHPSKEISIAWQVLDELNKMGFGIMITIFDPSQVFYPNDKVLVEICDIRRPVDVSTKVAEAYANELPEAICKAALLTTLIKEETKSV